MSILSVLLDNDLASMGILAFFLACIALVLGPIFLLIALIAGLANKKGEPKNKSANVLLKIGLISLLAGGLCLLLTAVCCSWV